LLADFVSTHCVPLWSHGGTDALGFATAIDVAIETVKNDLVSKIKTDVAIMTGLLREPGPAEDKQPEPSL
jgi:glycerol-3-phosphate acyltransferase PlsX